mmetsp:Transcript_60062/g.133860  ORF Transcript_60062/g.133860 Transcript_60062/m.133860 type:complete len:227 (+) Transcript_60062:735-1415(+)
MNAFKPPPSIPHPLEPQAPHANTLFRHTPQTLHTSPTRGRCAHACSLTLKTAAPSRPHTESTPSRSPSRSPFPRPLPGNPALQRTYSYPDAPPAVCCSRGFNARAAAGRARAYERGHEALLAAVAAARWISGDRAPCDPRIGPSPPRHCADQHRHFSRPPHSQRFPGVPAHYPAELAHPRLPVPAGRDACGPRLPPKPDPRSCQPARCDERAEAALQRQRHGDCVR